MQQPLAYIFQTLFQHEVFILMGRNAGHEPAYGQQYTWITKTNMDATICLENIRIKITCRNKRAPDVPVQVSKSDSLRESFCLSAE
jgi:hypothetical protein